MKISKLFAPLLFTFISLTILPSCEKDCPNPETNTTYPIEGTWVGTYAVNGSPTTAFYSFGIMKNGTVTVESMAAGVPHVSIGTWTLSGTTLTCNYKNISGTPGSLGLLQSSITTWNNTGKLDGTWKNDSGVTAAGTLTLSRIN